MAGDKADAAGTPAAAPRPAPASGRPGPDRTDAAYGRVTAAEFAALDFGDVTLVDLREDAVRLAQGELPGSVNLPFSRIGAGLSDVPAGKPVYVFCSTGELSGEAAELLADRGYDVHDVEGGFRAYREAVAGEGVPIRDAPAAGGGSCPAPAAVLVDVRGLKCPGPIVKVADAIAAMQPGDRALVRATEDAFAGDVRVWCERTGNVLESLEVGPDAIEASIVKAAPAPAPAPAPDAQAGRPHGKTFIVFSGDLDKTIAAFIMANGAAAMGREVTMFFTFWGLNILRRPERVRVRKGPIARAFGAMMPRGTRKLGLSRMNFGGAGARMIRSVMKRGGISSLEELVDTARGHGVRLVACQMSMEIMGITREELVDGVELGGVATFLGSGEQSDMSLFI